VLKQHKETVMTELLKKFAIVGVLAFPLAAMVSCENEGPFERAGENMDDTADDIDDNINDGLDDAGDNLEDAGEEVDEAVDDLDDR
jgi:hypothetical protein